jgi:hypothetical protein
MRGVISSSCARVHGMRAMRQTTPITEVPATSLLRSIRILFHHCMLCAPLLYACMATTHTDDLVRHLFLGSERQAPQVRASEKRSRTPCRERSSGPAAALFTAAESYIRSWVSTTSLLTIVLERHRSTARDKRAAVPLSGVLLHRAPPSKDVGGGVVGHNP